MTETEIFKQSIFNDNYQLPLVIGVTGHRQFLAEGTAEFREQIKDFFIRIELHWKTLHENNSVPPIVVLCGLAEGADQLVADIVIQLKNDGMKIQLIAVLPMPKYIYAHDFEPPDAISENALKYFQQFCNQADLTIELPLLPENSELKLNKESQYELLGRFISSHSYLLLALWEEEKEMSEISPENRKRGGTCDVVCMKLNDEPLPSDTENAFLGSRHVGPVVQILTRRQHANTNEINSWILRASGSGIKNKGKYSSIESDLYNIIDPVLEQLATFHLDVKKHQTEINATKPYPDEFPLSEPCMQNDDMQHLIKYYSVCSFLSGHYQKMNKRLLTVYCFGLGFLAVLFIYSSFFYFGLSGQSLITMTPQNLTSADIVMMSVRILYTLAGLSLIGVYFYFKKSGYYSRYHSYRSIAEGLRVQIFWRLAGIPDPVVHYYLSHQIDEINWLKIMLQTIMLPISITKNTEKNITNNQTFDLIKEHWIQEQLKFFDNRIKLNDALVKKWERLKVAPVLFIAMIWTTFKIWGSDIHKLIIPDPLTIVPFFCVSLSCFQSVVMILLGWLTIMLIAALSYCKLNSFQAISHRYRRMIPIFRRAEKLFNSSSDTSGKRRVILELGKEALAENVEWLLLKQEVDMLK
ncbi:MAG: hypothetical protein LBT09_00005 [Planctomycetaceae bacterium]|jgi:hypothetical protein|nr:hypothetical protein [Planctomycetaceae bacterium]